MQFKEIKGNVEIKKQLINDIVSNRISHAQLFFGNPGNAKLALALAYAQFLNCENKNNEDSCGECSSCLNYSNLTHPDLHIIFPVLKIKNTKTPISDNFIKEWRQAVMENPYLSLNNWIDLFSSENKTGQPGNIYKQEADNIHKKLSLKNYESQYRVILIWMPEKMRLETSNKLLKILEEPPKNTVFILISETPEKLLKTITSRVQSVRIPDFSKNEIIEHLDQEKLKNIKQQDIIRLSGKNLGNIIETIKNEEDNTRFFEDFTKWMRIVYKTDVQEISKWVDEISKKGRKHQKSFCVYAIKIIRECLIFNFTNKNLLKTTKEEQKFIDKFSAFIHEKNTILIVEKLEKTITAINRNANAKILFFELSLQISKFLKVKCNFVIK